MYSLTADSLIVTEALALSNIKQKSHNITKMLAGIKFLACYSHRVVNEHSCILFVLYFTVHTWVQLMQTSTNHVAKLQMAAMIATYVVLDLKSFSSLC